MHIPDAVRSLDRELHEIFGARLAIRRGRLRRGTPPGTRARPRSPLRADTCRPPISGRARRKSRRGSERGLATPLLARRAASSSDRSTPSRSSSAPSSRSTRWCPARDPFERAPGRPCRPAARVRGPGARPSCSTSARDSSKPKAEATAWSLSCTARRPLSPRSSRTSRDCSATTPRGRAASGGRPRPAAGSIRTPDSRKSSLLLRPRPLSSDDARRIFPGYLGGARRADDTAWTDGGNDRKGP